MFFEISKTQPIPTYIKNRFFDLIRASRSGTGNPPQKNRIAPAMFQKIRTRKATGPACPPVHVSPRRPSLGGPDAATFRFPFYAFATRLLGPGISYKNPSRVSIEERLQPLSNGCAHAGERRPYGYVLVQVQVKLYTCPRTVCCTFGWHFLRLGY